MIGSKGQNSPPTLFKMKLKVVGALGKDLQHPRRKGGVDEPEGEGHLLIKKGEMSVDVGAKVLCSLSYKGLRTGGLLDNCCRGEIFPSIRVGMRFIK